MSEPEAFDLRLLDPAEVRLLRAGGVLRMELPDRCVVRVRLTRAFPISDPSHYVCVLDGDGHDLGVIAEPARLDAASRALAEEALEARYFVPVVTKAHSVREDYGSVVWDVETDRGRKRYVVRALRDNLAELSPQRILVTDVDGNRFEVPDIFQLPPAIQTLILRNL